MAGALGFLEWHMTVTNRDFSEEDLKRLEEAFDAFRKPMNMKINACDHKKLTWCKKCDQVACDQCGEVFVKRRECGGPILITSSPNANSVYIPPSTLIPSWTVTCQNDSTPRTPTCQGGST